MNVIDVGTPPNCLKSEVWKTTAVRFHGFANLSTTRGEYVASPEFSCLGHQWILMLFPGGRAESKEGYAAVALGNRTNKSIEISYGFSVRDASVKEVVYHKPETKEFGAYGSGVGSAWCRSNLPIDQQLWMY